MNNHLKILVFLIFAFLGLYSTTTTLFIFLNIWQYGAFLAYEPNLFIRTYETILTLIGFTFWLFVVSEKLLAFWKRKEHGRGEP